MKTKLFLMGVALPALFAACTADEIVPQQDNFKTDLDKRAVVGEVVLNFGGAETRAALGDNSFNSIKFESGKDGIGARIIDELNAPSDFVNKTAFQNYTVKDGFASSNYQYVNNGNVWTSEALMVEGNYMFYFPYNAKNVSRTPVEIVLPLKQTVKPADKEKGYNNPIAELYAGENPSFVGYKFLEAKDQTLEQKVDMQHIFAYPQITLVNKYTTPAVPPATEAVKHPITVEKILLVSSNIVEKATIKHSEVVNKLNGVRQMTKDGKNLVKAVGSWTTPTGILNAKTSDIATFSGSHVNAEVVFEGGLTLEPDQKYAFNVVLPAATYTAGDLKMYVYLSDDKMFDGAKVVNSALDLNYGPGKRFPKEEYDFPAGKNPSVKATAGALATVELKGTLVATKDPAALIKTAAQFENMLKGVTSNNATLTEVASVSDIDSDTEFALGSTNGVADLVINDEVIAMLNTYLANGKIKFITKVQVEGNETGVILKNMAFDGKMQFIGGKATVTTGVTASATEVKGGVLTIANGSNALLNDITVNAGELVVKTNEFTTGNGNNIIVGNTQDDNNEVIATGKVSLVPATNSSIEISGAPNNFSMTDGELVIGENAQFNLATTSSIANAKVTNNGTLYVYSSYEVPAGVTLENNGAVTFNSTETLSNAGTINNYSDMELSGNTGTINVKQGSHTTIATNSGLIDNSEKAYVAITSANTGTVNYTFNSAVNVDGLDALDCKKYALNKLTFKGKVTVDKDFKATSFDGISKLEFAEGSELYLDAQVGTSVTEVLISGNVKWGGFAIGSSGLGFKNPATVTVKKNCTLTVTGLTVTGKTDSSLTFMESGETIDTTAGEEKGAVQNNGRVAGAKQDATYPVTWKGTALEATKVFP